MRHHAAPSSLSNINDLIYDQQHLLSKYRQRREGREGEGERGRGERGRERGEGEGGEGQLLLK